jgi:hypothetical protein
MVQKVATWLLKPGYGIVLITITSFVMAYYLRPDLWIWQYTIGPAQISYCELGNNPGRYHNKLVRVKAPVAGDEESLALYNAECDFWDNANMTEISLDPAYEPNSNIYNWLDEVQRTKFVPHQKTHEAIVTGWFDGDRSPGCFSSRYAMRVIKIEPLL